VQSTIESMRNAGMKVWMLTGDKVETATCIAISAGFKNRRQDMYFIRDLEQESDIRYHLNEFEKASLSGNTVLIIDGTSLSIIMNSTELEEMFFDYSAAAPAVCVCRCSPTQKALIV
jgi:phospholipid-translocating ATPase